MLFLRRRGVSNRRSGQLLAVVSAALMCAMTHAGASAATANSFKTLHIFCANGDCSDGEHPQAPLIADSKGNLYGTTANGGSHTWGTAFELAPNAAGTAWKEHVLYNFCAKNGSTCSDGQGPEAALLMDKAANLYGTTVGGGGVTSTGAVFELLAAPDGKSRKEKVLYRFCQQPGCADGESPSGPLIMDASGNFYGTTTSGGVNHAGAVFELAFNAKKKRWEETLPYSFCPQIGCPDGSNPTGGVIMDKSGNLYGVATTGGNTCNPGCGVVFELTFNTSKHEWGEHVLHDFVTAEGSGPQGTLIMDKSGNLYGVAAAGGTCPSASNTSCGSVYEMSFNTTKKLWHFTVIHDFCSKTGCADGADPASGLIMDKAGILYGTTAFGGSSTCSTNGTGCGVVFELLPNAKTNTWKETVLHTFCGSSGCADGSQPAAGLFLPCANHNGVYQCKGTLYGTAPFGGDSSFCFGQGCGVVFAQKP